MAFCASNWTRTLIASEASASGSLPFSCMGSRLGTERRVPLSLSELLEEVSVTRDSVRAGEMFRLPSTPESAAPLVCHSGTFCQLVSQEKALVPTSSASTARRE